MYRLAVRVEFSQLHQSKILIQQYLVDQYTIVESQILHQNKEKLRAEQFQGLQDFVVNHVQQHDLVVGRIVILTS